MPIVDCARTLDDRVTHTCCSSLTWPSSLHSFTRIPLTHSHYAHSHSNSLTHSLTFHSLIDTHSLTFHSLIDTHSHHMHSLTFICMYILCRYIRMLTVINSVFDEYIIYYFWWVLFYKEYVSVLTDHHQTIEHCKIWYLFLWIYNDLRKQDNWK